MEAQVVVRKDYAGELCAMIDADVKLGDGTKAQYRRAIARYVAAGGNILDASQLEKYSLALSSSGRSFLKAAVGKLTSRLALEAKRQATPDNLASIQAGLLRLEAVKSAIQIVAPAGIKAHVWLSKDEVKALLATCGDDIEGRRDYIILSLLVGTGVRREEAVKLTFDDISLKPITGKFRTVIHVKGKGKKERDIPISDKLADALAEWRAEIGEGRICRSFKRNKSMRDSISTVGLFHIVRDHGEQIGRPELAPHDMRRTFAEIGRQHGVDLYQISHLLGHESIETTVRYLNIKLDLETTISDFIPFE